MTVPAIDESLRDVINNLVCVSASYTYKSSAMALLTIFPCVDSLVRLLLRTTTG